MTTSRPGPVLIGFDGTRAAQRAVAEAGPLLAGQDVLVVVVWEAGKAFELAELETFNLDKPVADLDLSSAFDADRETYEAALRVAEYGAALAGNAGMHATGLAVADTLSVADTLVRLAAERAARAVVVGAHSHSRLSELFLGSTSQGVLDKAPCPVIVVRERSRHDSA